MSKEGYASCMLGMTKGEVRDFEHFVEKFDVSGTVVLKNIQTVGTSEEAVMVGDAGANCLVMAKNMDTANFVELRPGSGIADLIKLGPRPDAPAIFRLATGATLYAIADTAACDVFFMVISA